MSEVTKKEFYNLYSTFRLSNEIIDDFHPNNKFIYLWKMGMPPYPIYVRSKFSMIAVDVVLKLDKDNYIKGERTESTNAINALKQNPEILSKEKAKDYVVSLLEKGYKIISAPCLQHEDAKHFLSLGIVKIIK